MPAFIDLTGKTFGRLTAIEPIRYQGRIKWRCQCSCGNLCEVDGANLRSGKSLSCGCLRKESARNKKKNLIGQKFGRLTVIQETSERQCGAIVWLCKCECGNEIKVATGNLQSGHTQSCGCYKMEKLRAPLVRDVKGQRFGRLVALEYIPGSKQDGIRGKWKCKCDCGNIHTVSTSALFREDFTQSCGCLSSAGEEKISQLLKENNIIFERQKQFDTCRFPNTNRLARFDFFIDNKYLLEFDGKQHYFGWSNDKDNLKIVQQRDEFKNKWCEENNIPLIRIPYWKLEHLTIEDLLLKEDNK